MSTPSLPAGTVLSELRDRPAWFAGIVLPRPGTIFDDEATGERARVLADGRLVPVGYPRPRVTASASRTKELP